ncbi:M14 family metallopeptidase, partial [Luteimonas sp. SDU101]|uniref:M14 family metallopeptidase n=1 Tax=Luteimonas sp. SDU101 TaxID=3422593 RepID=UPI003EB85305
RPPPQADATTVAGAPVAAQAQGGRTWSFAEDGLHFDNRLPAARLSGVERLGAGRYRLHVAPETHPVNPSPWYGFRIRSEDARALDLRFSYPHGYRHRYLPKLSRDGRDWREAGPGEYSLGDAGDARLQLQMEPGELRVFAQPPLLPDDMQAWAARVAARVDARQHTFGRSVQGRPLRALEFGAGPEAPLLLVVGGQHPPENTGARAMMGFVETLAGDTAQARAFRRGVRVLVVPQLNPDGVVDGHWRGNAHGVDINRDWGPFAQPETRALRDLLAARRGGPVVFAIDFHSTFRDVYYTVAEDPSRKPGGVLHDWMAAMEARFPGRIEEKAYAATSAVFKNWAYCSFGAPAVTYEVGDTTPAATLGAVSRHAAESLMALLTDRPAAPPAPACLPAAAD